MSPADLAGGAGGADLAGFELHAVPWYSSGGLAEGCDYDFLRPRSAEELAFAEPVIGRS